MAVFGTCIPLVLLISAALTPVFASFNGVMTIKYMLPTFCYLNSVNSMNYRVRLLLYVLAVNGLHFLLSALRNVVPPTGRVYEKP